MTGISLPTLGGIAGLVPVVGTASHANVGAGFTSDDYTVPVDVIAWVTAWAVAWVGGTTPTELLAKVRTAAGADVGTFLHRATLVVLDDEHAAVPMMLLPGFKLRIETVGGDDTTDLEHSWAVVEFAYDEA